MKKIILPIMSIIAIHNYHAQTFSYNKGISQPVPTISSLATYTDIPVSIQTGIPKISYHLIDVSTNNSFANIRMELNYHAANISRDQWSGDLGPGWSLLGQGVISRENYDDPDESFDDNTKSFYLKNDFDDIYNYSIPGESGKFKFIRDTTNNTFKLINLTPTTSKIEYQRNSNQSTLILDSFIITNDKGIKYKFNTYNISSTYVWRWGYPWLNAMYGNLRYRSAFFLTSIVDENDQELVKFNYYRDMIYPIGTGDAVAESELNKLSSIEIKNRAIINLEYNEKPYIIKNDKFNLKSITLKTSANQFVSKYNFEVQGSLKSFSKVDMNNNVIEKTQFSYSGVGIAPGYPPPEEDEQYIYNTPMLNTIKSSTGGIIQYDFEFIPYFIYNIEKNIPAPTEYIGSISFNQFSNSNKKYFFTLNEEKNIIIEAPVSSLAGYSWSLLFFRKNGSTYQNTPYSISNVFSDDPNSVPETNKITFTPGEYYVTLGSSAMDNLQGEVTFNANKIIGDPTTIIEQRSYRSALPRVMKIKYYNEPGTNFLTTTPTKIQEYNYNRFNDPSISSGYYIEGGGLPDGFTPANPTIIYKNVKVSGNTEGYTKFYYKATDAYPDYNEPSPYPGTTYGITPYYNFTREGLLEKEEIYNTLHQKISENTFDYLMEEYPSPPYPLINAPNNIYTKTAWMKYEKVVSRNYFSSAFTETKTEIFRTASNYRTNLERITLPEGTINETTYSYAHEKGNQLMIDRNMVGIPLETVSTQTIGNTTKTLSRSETIYPTSVPTSQSGNLVLPLSVKSYDVLNNNASYTEATYDKYDSKGNLQQYTTKDGISTVIIWGYDHTQPIAKIEGAQLSGISQSLIDTIVNASNTDAQNGTETSEQNLISALDTFRSDASLSGYQISTYTYDPLIGVRSITPPSGIREYYRYDSANRLEKVIDSDKKVLKEFKYNYKN